MGCQQGRTQHGDADARNGSRQVTSSSLFSLRAGHVIAQPVPHPTGQVPGCKVVSQRVSEERSRQQPWQQRMPSYQQHPIPLASQGASTMGFDRMSGSLASEDRCKLRSAWQLHYRPASSIVSARDPAESRYAVTWLLCLDIFCSSSWSNPQKSM